MTLRTLQDAERYLDGFINRERRIDYDYEKLGLARVQGLLMALGHPERGLPSIHVAGSNGKGTVAYASEVLLLAAGLRVGTFTSPHLESWLERFRVGGELAPERTLIAVLERMRPLLERLRADPETCPSFFDVVTALAFALFRAHDVEAGVFEVGLGGRLDSTNVVEARVSVLTAVQLEHTDKLGDTIEAIAREKAGIFRKGVPVVHGPLYSEAYGALMARAISCDTELEEVEAAGISPTPAGQSFRLPDGRRVQMAQPGAHQATNVAIAVRACEIFLDRSLSSHELEALSSFQVPARLERFGRVMLDCAHTVEAARGLRETVEATWPGCPWVLGLSISADKDVAGVLAELAPHAQHCVVTRADPARSVEPEELAELARRAGIGSVEVCEAPSEALLRVLDAVRGSRVGVLAGSIYFAGAIRRALSQSAGSL